MGNSYTGRFSDAADVFHYPNARAFERAAGGSGRKSVRRVDAAAVARRARHARNRSTGHDAAAADDLARRVVAALGVSRERLTPAEWERVEAAVERTLAWHTGHDELAQALAEVRRRRA